MREDPQFLVRRAIEERNLAARATHWHAYKSHLLMAHEYERRLIQVTGDYAKD